MNKFQLFRMVLPTHPIQKALEFYEPIFEVQAKKVSEGRFYFNLGNVILVCYDSIADGDGNLIPPNPEHIYISTSHIQESYEKVKAQNPLIISPKIQKMPWGENSFYFIDPFGNKMCFVEQGTEYRGSIDS